MLIDHEFIHRTTHKTTFLVICLCGLSIICFGCTAEVETVLESPAKVVLPGTPAGFQPTNTIPKVENSALPPEAPLTTPIASVTPSQNFVCSPITGFSTGELINSIVNPYQPPPRGSDNPHQGVDIAEIGEGLYALEGASVEAVLNGKVAGVIFDRFPYGNAILIETPLDLLPARLVSSLNLPQGGLPLEELPTLYCPNDFSLVRIPAAESQSLYILYAHMRDTSKFKLGDIINCGQEIGVIGNTGNSI